MRQLLLLLLISNLILAQETPASFLKNICEYKTERNQYSEGVKLKLSVPCLWKRFLSEAYKKQTKFHYGYGKNSISEVLNIKTLPNELTKADLEDFYSQKTLTQMCKEAGTFISVRKVEIDGFPCAELIYKTMDESSSARIYLYFSQYIFISKNKMILVAFSTGSTSDQNSKKIFTTYKSLFQSLIKMTKFID